MYLFGFGSLINLSSAQKSFKRVLSQKDLLPVKIKGYERVWNAIESIQFEEENESINGVFLNIKKNENSTLYGVMIEISDEELEILKLREKNYSCITIKKEDVLSFEAKDDLIAFMTTREDKLAKIGDKNCFIPFKYTQIVKEALNNYDEDFKKDFEKIFENYPFVLKNGNYTFTD
ncbi:MAG: gamma-glutamylcyclotransferase, partial [Arcobacter sp.]|nr:gamma-glutamylcyclotransferase [Arcobacter sp.]